jgi:hypothetical protein
LRTLLRNIPTRLYVESPGTWTHKPEAALDFGGMRRALGFACFQDLRRMELVFASEGADQWLAVPVSSVAFPARKLLEGSKFEVLVQAPFP